MHSVCKVHPSHSGTQPCFHSLGVSDPITHNTQSRSQAVLSRWDRSLTVTDMACLLTLMDLKWRMCPWIAGKHGEVTEEQTIKVSTLPLCNLCSIFTNAMWWPSYLAEKRTDEYFKTAQAVRLFKWFKWLLPLTAWSNPQHKALAQRIHNVLNISIQKAFC